MTRKEIRRTGVIGSVILGVVLVMDIPYVAKAESQEALRRAERQARPSSPVQAARPTDLQARERFLEIERIARLPRAEQAGQLPRVYRDLAPRYMSPFITMIISSYRSNILDNDHFDVPGGDHESRWASQLTEAAKALTTEQVADKINAGMWLNVGARVRCLQIFKDHPQELAGLIDTDLDSGNTARISRAAATILAAELRSYSRRLIDMFLAELEDTKTSERKDQFEAIRRTLLFLHDPDIIPILLAKVKENPRLLIHVSGFFQHPLYHKPVDPMLFSLVSSEDREVSYHAAYALAECSDARLAPLTASFAQDSESRFRWLAAHWSLNMPRQAFLSIRQDLQPLLQDKAEDVFEQALRCFTRHRDPEAGKVILALLKQSEIPSQLEVAVMQCLHELADSHFGYNMHNWGPGQRKNSEAIETFEAWLKENGYLL